MSPPRNFSTDGAKWRNTGKLTLSYLVISSAPSGIVQKMSGQPGWPISTCYVCHGNRARTPWQPAQGQGKRAKDAESAH